jgi:hypothetical protein
MMQPMEIHQTGMSHNTSHPHGAANIIVTSNGEVCWIKIELTIHSFQIATGDNPHITGERIVLQPNQRLIIVDPVTGQQKQIQLVQVPTTSSQQPPQHHILITTQSIAPQTNAADQDDNRRMAFDEYFMEQGPPSVPTQQQMQSSAPVYQQQQAQQQMDNR